MMCLKCFWNHVQDSVWMMFQWSIFPNHLTQWIPSLSHSLPIILFCLKSRITKISVETLFPHITQWSSIHGWTEFLRNNTQLLTTIRVTQVVDESQGGFVFSSQLQVLGDFNKKSGGWKWRGGKLCWWVVIHREINLQLRIVWWENRKSSPNHYTIYFEADTKTDLVVEPPVWKKDLC